MCVCVCVCYLPVVFFLRSSVPLKILVIQRSRFMWSKTTRTVHLNDPPLLQSKASDRTEKNVFLWFSVIQDKIDFHCMYCMYTKCTHVNSVCVRCQYVRTQQTAGWSPHSWCLILTPLSFHLCSCFPLLTFQTNLVRQTDHHCPAESLPLSLDNLSANLLILFFSWIPFGFLLCLLFSFILLLYFQCFATDSQAVKIVPSWSTEETYQWNILS